MQLNRNTTAGIGIHIGSRAALSALALLVAGLAAPSAQAQNFPITPGQRATAEQVASKGVPISELAPNAPDIYVVKRGDTLWAISGIYLTRPWRWPELWGMNLQQIRNPHLIYPGQKLYLEKKDGYARLRSDPATDDDKTVRLSPRTRYSDLGDGALPTLPPHLIEPFLTEPLVVDEATLANAARVVAARDDRVLISKGDRAYARGAGPTALLMDAGKPRDFRIFRNSTPLKDPVTGEVLGFEGQYVGQAVLARPETTRDVTESSGTVTSTIVPATIDVVSTKEEIRVGDRLLPEPERQMRSYTPHAPAQPVDARVVSIYGSAVANAAQSQVVAINRGTRDGMEVGHVLALLTGGNRMVDRTDAARPDMALPYERNGLLMVFRTFDRVSYGLILQIDQGVRVGDRLINPR